MTKQCPKVEPLLSELTDGTLDEARSRAVRGHLRECDACRRQAQALQDIAAAAGSLEAVDPPSSVWEGIARRLDEEEVAFSRRPRWWWWWQAWRRPLLGGAAAVAVAAFALVVLERGREPRAPAPVAASQAPTDLAALLEEATNEVLRAEKDYAHAVAELRDIVGQEKTKWPAQMQAEFDQNLRDIDAAVERMRTAAHRAPDNLEAQEALHASYRRQIDFLQEAAVRGGLP